MKITKKELVEKIVESHFCDLCGKKLLNRYTSIGFVEKERDYDKTVGSADRDWFSICKSCKEEISHNWRDRRDQTKKTLTQNIKVEGD